MSNEPAERQYRAFVVTQGRDPAAVVHERTQALCAFHAFHASAGIRFEVVTQTF